MTLLEQTIAANEKKYRKIFLDALNEKKEAPTMQVEYNGFTGELVKLERITKLVSADSNIINTVYTPTKTIDRYNVSIYDSEKKVTISADGVKLSDIKFLGGSVSFGG